MEQRQQKIEETENKIQRTRVCTSLGSLYPYVFDAVVEPMGTRFTRTDK